MERYRLAIAERDRAGLVEQQRVDVARGFDRAAGHREHVALDHAVHAGDADRREQAADRRRDQADEQRDQHVIVTGRLPGLAPRTGIGCSVTQASRKIEREAAAGC
jgi:hypothetical protein